MAKTATAVKKASSVPASIAYTDLPRIGSTFHGGIFVGIAAGEEGHPDNAIITLPDDTGKRMTHKKATAWAASLGAALPTRDEAALCYANARAIFAREWHWASTQSAGFESSAWFQDFGLGFQGTHPQGRRAPRPRRPQIAHSVIRPFAKTNGDTCRRVK